MCVFVCESERREDWRGRAAARLRDICTGADS